MENKDKRNERIQIIFLVLLFLAILSLISAIVVLLKNKEMFQDDPLTFGIAKYGIDYCTCYRGGYFFSVDETGFSNMEVNLIGTSKHN